MLFASLIGFSSVTLKWFGVISVESVLTLRYGTRDVLLGMIGWCSSTCWRTACSSRC